MTGAVRTSAIVLAGGASRRFGSPKLSAVVGGRPLLHLAITAVAAAATEVIVVGPAGEGIVLPDPPDGLDVPVRLARDAAPGGGPLAGLAAGLAVAGEPVAIVVGGDQPELVPALLAELARVIENPGGPEAVVLDDEGRMRPLPSAVRVEPARHAVAAAQAEGRRSLLAAFDRLGTVVLAAERWRELDPVGASLRDVDRPEDLVPRG